MFGAVQALCLSEPPPCTKHCRLSQLNAWCVMRMVSCMLLGARRLVWRNHSQRARARMVLKTASIATLSTCETASIRVVLCSPSCLAQSKPSPRAPPGVEENDLRSKSTTNTIAVHTCGTAAKCGLSWVLCRPHRLGWRSQAPGSRAPQCVNEAALMETFVER